MKKLEWTTVQRKVNDLLPLEINPRKITEDKRKKLIESINKFNLAEIPTINKDNTLISGHQRMKAMQMIGRGDEVIDVRMPNRQLSLKELKEYNIISNTHAGEFDFDILDLEFGDIDLVELDIMEMPIEKLEKTKIEKQELKPFKKTHYLISFPPEKLLLIQKSLEEILKHDFVEHEQSSN